MPDALLPPTSTALFARAEVNAERTVAMLRILIALSLALVLAAVVLQTPPELAGDAVLVQQWLFAGGTLLAYLMLGLASLLVVARGIYRPWMAWLAVTGDCAFLLANVALGLANTGLPADYLVSMPPIWIAPVVLAFGALRFNPLLQSYMIFLLVAGFVAIGAFGFPMHYVSTLPLPAILALFFSFPPNMIRLAMFVLAGAILVIASARARALLARAISETERALNLTRYLPRQVADRLAAAGLDALRRGQRRDVAVLFVDIRGFTRISEAMTPEDLSGFVTEFRGRVRRAIDAGGGIVDKFIGDAAMAVFGLGGDEPNAAGSAIESAGRILKEIAAWGDQRRRAGLEPVAVGIGVHWGAAFCGAIGDESRLEFTVLGDAVNVAARLEELTKEAGLPLLASHETLAAAGLDPAGAGWQPLPPTVLRGRQSAIAVFGRRL